jgi:hypothetical protein
VLRSIVRFSSHDIHLFFMVVQALHIVHDVISIEINHIYEFGVHCHKPVISFLSLTEASDCFVIFLSVHLREHLRCDFAAPRHSSAAFFLRMVKILTAGDSS